MTTLEDNLKKGVENSARITTDNDALLAQRAAAKRTQDDQYGDGDYATAPGCGTKAAILALLPLGATLAAWIGGVA